MTPVSDVRAGHLWTRRAVGEPALSAWHGAGGTAPKPREQPAQRLRAGKEELGRARGRDEQKEARGPRGPQKMACPPAQLAVLGKTTVCVFSTWDRARVSLRSGLGREEWAPG